MHQKSINSKNISTTMKQFKVSVRITNPTEESLGRYLTDISRVPMISAEREVELAQQMRKGGKKGAKAKEELITSNLRFVVSVAKQYQPKNIPLVDLINEGNIGLIKAAEKFDETRGFKFTSYAVDWIRQGILQFLNGQSNTIRVPQNQIGVKGKIKKATSEFLHEHQRNPSVEELSEMLGLDLCIIEKALRANTYMASIDEPLLDSEGDTRTMGDTLASTTDYAADRYVDHESMSQDLIQVLNSVLNMRERIIVQQSFGIDCQERELEDIGADMGLTRERVRQIKNHAIEKIRESAESKLLFQHLA